MSLVDRGANDGVAGDNVRVIFRNEYQNVNVRGLDDHEVNNINIGTVGAYMESQRGPVIVIMNQYALLL